LNALLAPIGFINSQFRAFINTTNQDLKWNGQTISLEGLLQNSFGGGIKITNNNLTGQPFYVYGSANSRNPMIYPSGNPSNPITGEINAFDPEAIDFVVEVPLGTSDNRKDEIAALIRQYKLYGKRFTIITQS
jgi:hypothetical protein